MMTTIDRVGRVMRTRRPRLAGAVGALAALTLSAVAAAASPAGVWIDDTGQGAVEIAPCGQALCGRIVWLKKTTDGRGEPLTDKLNPRVSERSRPICGLQVIGNLARQPDGTWDEGWIYDPKQGKAFDVAVEVAGANRLRVIGYLGTRFFSRTLIWTRAPSEISRCAPREASARPAR